MNLLQAAGGDAIHFDGVDGAIPRPDTPSNFTLGVRPSDVRVGDGDLTATVELIESMGATALIHMNLGVQALRAQIAEPHGLVVGQAVQVSFTTIHPFDTSSGERLW